jgi:2-dehydro-3-deoxygluconokinase
MGRVVCIGECMVELAPADAPGLYALGFAGDTFNAAWYLRRRLPPGWQVDYLTAVGTDAVSDRFLSFAASAGLGTAHIARRPDRTLGLYLIELTGTERSFAYWRGQSAARTLAQDTTALDAALNGATLAYLSGITLAILLPEDRATLLRTLARHRAQGTRIAFDPNLRPRLWPDTPTMRSAIMQAAAVADIVLPSFSDEATHFADPTPQATAARYTAAGATDVIVKDGENPILAGTLTINPTPAPLIVDTTAAGDSFNAAFLAARLAGAPLPDAVRAGADLAARVIGGRGALVDA